MQLHIVVPNLLWPQADHDAYAEVEIPALEALLTRGRLERGPAQDLETYLCERFGVPRQQDWPLAALSLIGEDEQPGSKYWLRADPVHLAINRGQLVLADSTLFDITQAEAASFIETLNGHFRGEDVIFAAPDATRWYCGLKSTPSLVTTPLSQVRGRNIDPHRPQGADAMRWQRVQTEAQMLLHEHPTNEARETRSQLTINSVWFWGGGTVPTPSRSPWTQVWTNLVWLQGLARQAKASYLPLPQSLDSLLRAPTPGDSVLMVIDDLAASASYADVSGWQTVLSRLESNYFAHLMPLLKSKQLDQVTLTTSDAGAALTWRITPVDLWKFWRTRKSIAELGQT